MCERLSPFVRRCLGWLAATCLLAGAPALAAGKWQVDAAPERLTVITEDGHAGGFRIDLPRELQDRRVYGAFTEHGEQIPFTEYRDPSGSLVVVELEVPGPKPHLPPQGQRSQEAEFELYLGPADGKIPANRPPRRRTPVMLTVEPLRVIARPTTCAEYLSFLRRTGSSLIRRERRRSRAVNTAPRAVLQELPDEDNAGLFRAFVQAKHETHYRLSCELLVDSPRLVRLAVPNDEHGAWFVFLDQQGVFAWGESPGVDEEYVRSAVFVLASGRHRLDLTGILRRGEQFPRLLVRGEDDTTWQPFAEEHLLSAEQPTGWYYQHRDGEPFGCAVDVGRQFKFSAAEDILGLVSVDRKPAGVTVLLGDRPAAERGFLPLALPAELMVSCRRQDAPAGQPSSLTVPLVRDWLTTRGELLNLVVYDVPWLEPATGPLPLPFRVETSRYVHGLLRKDGQWLVARTTDSGRALPPQELAFPESGLLEIPPQPAEVARLTLSLRLGDCQVAPTVAIRLLPPASESLPSPGGDNQLRLGEELAVIRRVWENTGAPQPVRQARARPANVFLLDDWIGPSVHPFDDLRPAAELARLLEDAKDISGRCAHAPLSAAPADLGAPELRKFTALREVLSEARPGDLVVLALGHLEFEAGLDLRDYQGQLRYLVEHCLYRGVVPALVTPPARTRSDITKVQPFALLVRELAAEYQVPCVDVFTQTVLRRGIADFYQVAPERPELLAATPHAEGRRWALRQIAERLSQWSGESPP